MLNKSFYILFSLLFFQHACIGKLLTDIPSKIEKRGKELAQKEDSLIVYYKICSGCINGIDNSAMFLYKKKAKYIYEYFAWSNENGDITKHVVSKKKSKYLSQLYKFVSNNFDGLKEYDGYRDLSGETIAKKRNDTSAENRVYLSVMSHGPSVEYTIKFGDKYLRTGTSFMTDIKYHIDTFPEVGTLLLLLNIVYFKEGYLLILDK